MQDFKVAIANCLKEKIEDLSLEEILGLIEIPPNKDMGDYAFPCFKLAKVFRKAPNMIASDLSETIEAKGDISKVMPMGGYVNFFVPLWSRLLMERNDIAHPHRKIRRSVHQEILHGSPLS